MIWPFPKLRPSPTSPQPALAPAFTCHAVRTASGAWLGIATGSHTSVPNVVATPDMPARSRIVLLTQGPLRQQGYLLASDTSPFIVGNGPPEAAALPVWLERRPASGAVSLCHAIDPKLRLASATQDGSGGGIAFALGEPGPAQEYVLEPIDQASLPPKLLSAAREIAQATSTPLRWRDMLAASRAGTLRAGLVGPMLSHVPVDELQDLAGHLLHAGEDREAVRQGVENDPWTASRLDDLLAWHSDRRTRGRGVVRPADADDLPGTISTSGHPPRLGVRLHALVRRAVQPRRMACLLGSARNEGPYLLEWIAYHRSIGFDRIVLYTNDNTDGSDDLLGLLADAGEITWIDQQIGPTTLPQHRAYAHALSVLPEMLDYRWTLIADLDEYFGFDVHSFAGVADYLAWQERRQPDAVALPWLLHLAAGAESWRDAPSIDRFTHRRPMANPQVKTMFRTNRYWTSNCHYPVASLNLPASVLAQNGQPHVRKMPDNNPALAHDPQTTHAWISHYIFRSAPELLMKIARGQGDVAAADRDGRAADLMSRFLELSRDRLTADPRMPACAAGLPTELARLRALPGVAGRDAEIKHVFATSMEETRRRFVRTGGEPGEPASRAAFRALLTRQGHDALFSGAA